MKFTFFIPAILWLIISTILLAMPGNELPQSPLFNIPYFDKMVHLTMFLLLTGLFCYPLKFSGLNEVSIKSWFISIGLYSVAYGIVMEFVQKYFIAGRSFDVADIFFDGMGSFVGMVMAQVLLKK